MKIGKKMLSWCLVLALLLTLAPLALASEPEEGEPELPRPVLLAVCSGTGYTDDLYRSVGKTEELLAEAYPAYEIRRAFADPAVIDVLRERDGETADSVPEALARLADDGVKEVLVLPEFLREDGEYEALTEALEAYVGVFDDLRLGRALLDAEDGPARVAKALSGELRRWERRDTAVVLVDRGAEGEKGLYAALQEVLTAEEYSHVLVGSLGTESSLEDTIALVQETGVKKVVLFSLLFSAGESGSEDIFGDGETSWKSAFSAEGFDVQCVQRGIGEYEPVRQLLAANVEQAVLLTEPAVEEPAEEPEEGPAEEEPEEEPEEGPAEEEPAEELEAEPAEEEPEEEPKEEPAEEPEEEERPLAPGGVLAADLVPGTYPLRVLTSSSLLRFADAVLAVEEDGMTAVLTLEGRRYGELYLGAAAEAERADEEDIIPFAWSEDGAMTFTVPVAALDAETACAVWSIRQGRWIDRILIFSSEDLPAEAFAG